MEKGEVIKLTKKLLAKDPDNIYICGPSYENDHLRVYAYGGFLCGLPTTKKMGVTLLSEEYLTENLALCEELQELKKNKPNDNEAKLGFLWEHWKDLMLAMQNHSQPGTNEETERSQQTVISRRHTDFSDHDGTVVCDFQFSIPKENRQDEERRPAFDLVTFSMKEPGHGVFTLVELKCNASTCGGENGLAKHAEDMMDCMEKSTSDWCKEQLLNRLRCMRDYELLQDCPDALDRLTPENVDLRAGFLFTSGEGLGSQERAAALCETYISKTTKVSLGDFSYCFADSPKEVNLSDMKSWKEFQGN